MGGNRSDFELVINKDGTFSELEISKNFDGAIDCAGSDLVRNGGAECVDYSGNGKITSIRQDGSSYRVSVYISGGFNVSGGSEEWVIVGHTLTRPSQCATSYEPFNHPENHSYGCGWKRQ